MAEVPPDTTNLSLHAGEKIGAYTVVEVIGTGGSGVVYKAHDPLLDRHVAIKHLVLSASVDADRLRDLARREAAAHKQTAAAKPKHLVQFIELIDDPRGIMLISEFVQGVSLEQRLAANGRPHDERAALGIVAATAKALEGLHKAGLVHRDLKPANILMPRTGGLKLADFGLASLIGEQESLPLGTVRYMAPELLRGEPPTPGADLYALGMIAYELLAGRDKFNEAFKTVLRDRRNPALRWMKWHTNPRVAAPSLTTLIPDTPPTLAELIARMMDKDPARRIATAREVVDAVRRHFIGNEPPEVEPDAAGPESLTPPTAPLGQTANPTAAAAPVAAAAPAPGDTALLPTRSKLPWIIAALLGFWIVVGGAIYLSQQRNERLALEAKRDVAREQFNKAKQETLGGNYTAAMAGFDVILDEWPGDSDPAKFAATWRGFAKARLAEESGDYAAALAGYEAFDQSPQGDREVVRPIIETVRRKRGFQVALESIRDSIERRAFLEGRETISQWRAEQLTDAETAKLNEVEGLLNAGESRARVAVLLRQANILAAQGQLDQAITVLEQRKVLPPDGQRLLESLRTKRGYSAALADAEDAVRTGRVEDAIAAFRRAQELRDDPAVAQKLSRLEARQAVRVGARLLDEGKLEDAAAQFETALLKDPDNADAQRYRSQIGSVAETQAFLLSGDQAMARGDFATAVSQYAKAFELDPLPVIQGKLDEAKLRDAIARAGTAIAAGDLEAAQQLLDDAKPLAPDDAELAAAAALLDTHQRYQQKIAEAEVFRDAGEYGKALRTLNSAKKILETPDVQRRLSETRYTQLVTQARAYIASDYYLPAKANLEEAARIDYTDEVKELLDQVAAAMTDNPSGS